MREDIGQTEIHFQAGCHLVGHHKHCQAMQVGYLNGNKFRNTVNSTPTRAAMVMDLAHRNVEYHPDRQTNIHSYFFPHACARACNLHTRQLELVALGGVIPFLADDLARGLPIYAFYYQVLFSKTCELLLRGKNAQDHPPPPPLRTVSVW